LNYALHLPATMIVGALALDAVFGDPTWLPHPVRLIGRAIAAGDRYLHADNPRSDLMSGALLSIVVVAAAALSTWIIVAIFQTLSSYAGALAALLIAWTTLALRGLDDAAREVERHLKIEDEGSARQAIQALVGRDPETLDRSGLIRGTIESIAENSSDGVVAPLFFLFAAGPVGDVAYKAINTLDSMIGHRDERYLYFGRAAARIDDAANLIPARLSALCIAASAAFTTRRSLEAIRTCVADARKHLSPNAGFPESAMAGALGVQLGGAAIYDGQLEHRAVIGVEEREPTAEDITVARSILRISTVIACVSLALVRNAVMRR
jgi:adenosylcobinamide-phosphate synthase